MTTVLTEQPLTKNRSYVAVSLTHLMVDVLNNGRNLLFAILAVSLGLSNTRLALLALLYNAGNAVLQPVFGWMADRWGSRRLVVLGMAWMILFYTIGSLASSTMALVAITIASLGSGMFHPAGTLVASQSSEERRTQATAGFFMMGQVGLFLGPIFAGILLDLYDRPGYVALALLAVVPLVASYAWVHDSDSSADPKKARREVSNELNWRTLIPLVVVMVTINTVGFMAITFVPKLYTELGDSPTFVGWLSGMYMGGSAVGGLLGGNLGDRFGAKPVILLAAIAGIFPVYIFPLTRDYLLLFLLFSAGFFIGMPHSVLVIKMQNLIPGSQAFASGLTLGIMFFGGSVGSYFLGNLADAYGLIQVLQWTAGILILTVIAGFCCLALVKPPIIVHRLIHHRRYWYK